MSPHQPDQTTDRATAVPVPVPEPVAVARLWAARTRFVDADVFADVTEVRDLPLHRFSVHAVRDRRVTRLHDGEPPLALPRANPDEGVPALGVPTSLKQEETPTHVLPRSIQVASCRDCDGRGQRRHEDCRGSGRVFCPAREDCAGCAGSGRLVHADGSRYRCGSCQGRGARTCGRCRGIGERTCPGSGCRQGSVTCEPCRGAGERTTYRTVTVRREVALLERWESPAAGAVPFTVPWRSAEPVFLALGDLAEARVAAEPGAADAALPEGGTQPSPATAADDPGGTGDAPGAVLHPVPEVDGALREALATAAGERRAGDPDDLAGLHVCIAVDSCPVTELTYRRAGETGQAWVVGNQVCAPDAIQVRSVVLHGLVLALAALAVLAGACFLLVR